MIKNKSGLLRGKKINWSLLIYIYKKYSTLFLLILMLQISKFIGKNRFQNKNKTWISNIFSLLTDVKKV